MVRALDPGNGTRGHVRAPRTRQRGRGAQSTRPVRFRSRPARPTSFASLAVTLQSGEGGGSSRRRRRPSSSSRRRLQMAALILAGLFGAFSGGGHFGRERRFRRNGRHVAGTRMGWAERRARRQPLGPTQAGPLLQAPCAGRPHWALPWNRSSASWRGLPHAWVHARLHSLP